MDDENKLPTNVKIIFEHYRFAAGDARVYEFARGHGHEITVAPERFYRGRTPWKPDSRGGLTICRAESNKREVAFGVAECSPKDNFSYRIGRKIALGRMIKVLLTKAAVSHEEA